MKYNGVLKDPTVADVVAWLLKQPQDKLFFIEDPDTNWTIDVIHTLVDDSGVWFTGMYEEMRS